jgi:ribosomal protein S12 methylthiotransferase accessory factor
VEGVSGAWAADVEAMAKGPSYRLAAGLEITRLPDTGYLLHSDFVAVRLSGDEATEFVERALVGLREPRTAEAIAAGLPGYTLGSVVGQLERLRAEGVLTTAEHRGPHVAAYDAVGMGADWTAARLAAATVVVFGLEGHGAQLADFLARLGVGALRLVDPGAWREEHLALASIGELVDVGQARSTVVARALHQRYPTVTLTTGVHELDEARVLALCEGADLLVGCFDRGMSAAHHWINRASLALEIPALFSEVRATGSLVGPLVIPGSSSCFMCYRMRTVAAKPDFDRVMAIEEHYDGARAPDLAGRPLLPGICLQTAASLGQEIVRALLRIEQPALVDRVWEHDALSGARQDHSVIRVADCPVCGQKKKRQEPPRLAELVTDAAEPGDLSRLVDVLVSPRTGLLTDLAPTMGDATEPARPYVYRVRISNHQFLSERDEDRAVCSGKGSTPAAALVSALGEAVERYCAARWSPEEILYARRADLPDESLDPRRLVLYDESQYASVPYPRYGEQTVLGWMRARSLITGELPWVPAMAAVMDYAVHDPSEHLFPVTSNGLAAGPTLADAVLRAIYEVVERDAFMLAWLHRWPGRAHDAASHPDADVRELAEAYRRRGVELHLVRLTTDQPVAVFAGITRQRGGLGGPAAVVGLGADLDPVAAARKAAMEVAQVRPSLRRRSRTDQAARVAELAADPLLVETLEDHALLYASEAYGRELDFLVGERAAWDEGEGPALARVAQDVPAALSLLVEHFRLAGQDVLYVDLSSEDLRPFGLHCARAILPDYQPIWFGRKERRLGGTRVRELPQRLGLASALVSIDSLNPLPHPLA